MIYIKNLILVFIMFGLVACNTLHFKILGQNELDVLNKSNPSNQRMSIKDYENKPQK